MAFNIKIPFVVATHVKKFAATSSLKNKNKAAALGSVLGLLYYHNGVSAQQVVTAGQAKSATSAAQVAGAYAVDTYLQGSAIAIPTGGYTAGTLYSSTFDMVKTAAGTAQFTITLRIGTLGTTADAAICAFAFAVGTAAVDSGVFQVRAFFRSVGAGTTAVVVGIASCSHALAATGLVSTGASGFGQIQTTSAGFDSTIASTIVGLSVNGGASFSGTNSFAEASLRSY